MMGYRSGGEGVLHLKVRITLMSLDFVDLVTMFFEYVQILPCLTLLTRTCSSNTGNGDLYLRYNIPSQLTCRVFKNIKNINLKTFY